MTGRWVEMALPIADKFKWPGAMGMDLKIDPDAAQATSETIMLLAQTLDAYEVSHREWRAFNRLMAGIFMLIGICLVLS